MLLRQQTRSALGSQIGALREGPLSDVVQVKVALIEIVPPIWRRLRVPVNLTLRRFHSVLQETMGWQNVHPHRFRIGEASFGKPSDPSDALKDSRWVTIQDVLAAGVKTFHYAYGSGGSWVHELRVEARGEGSPENQRPVCLGGESACPPEESGGPDDYVDSLFADSVSYPQPGFRPEPLREDFDPEQFDVKEVNAALAYLR
ncbi:MAG: plasmid pRiA4b ORF-3 family protein [Acidobacteriota bacterium]